MDHAVGGDAGGQGGGNFAKEECEGLNVSSLCVLFHCSLNAGNCGFFYLGDVLT